MSMQSEIRIQLREYGKKCRVVVEFPLWSPPSLQCTTPAFCRVGEQSCDPHSMGVDNPDSAQCIKQLGSVPESNHPFDAISFQVMEHHQLFMRYYRNGIRNAIAGEKLYNAGCFPESLYLAILSCENFLKAAVSLVDPDEKCLKVHDLAALYHYVSQGSSSSVVIASFLMGINEFRNYAQCPDEYFIVNCGSLLEDLFESVALVKIYAEAFPNRGLAKEVFNAIHMESTKHFA